MDIASLIGLLVGVGCLGFVFYEVSHGHLMMFYSQEGVLMVIGGSISVCFMAMPMDKIKAVPVSDKAGHQNVPTTPVTINKVSLEK